MGRIKILVLEHAAPFPVMFIKYKDEPSAFLSGMSSLIRYSECPLGVRCSSRPLINNGEAGCPRPPEAHTIEESAKVLG